VTRPDADVAELPADPGEQLRRHREAAGLTEQEAAERLNLDVGVLTALESNDFAALGAPVFVRGHLKRYASLLGLPADALLGAYDRSQMQLAQPSLIPRARAEMMPMRGPSRWPWLLGGVALFLAAAGLVAYVGQNGLRLPWNPLAQPTADSSLRQPELPTGPASSPTRNAAPAAATVAQGGTPAATVAASTPGAAAAGEPVAAADGRLSLQLGFGADSWVEIYDSSGKAVLYDLGKAGTERTVVGVPPLSVTVGNAPAVSLRVNGQPVRIPTPPAGQTVARFNVGNDGSVH
jgi:cytoskeleton protein RodZ